MKEIPGYSFRYLIQEPVSAQPPRSFSEKAAARVAAFHRRLPSYEPTSLVRLARLAREWNLKDIFVKDESTRFGLKAFKVLGGSYAVARLVCQKIGRRLDEVDFAYLVSEEVRERTGEMTFTTATDGNHGRGIAWAAQQLGQKAIIYMPRGSAPSRVDNIRSHGAVVEVTDLVYDDAVRLSRRMAAERGWHIVQDTAWEGYTEIPDWIMQGYMTMCLEAADALAELRARPTHVFVQAGVGALAAAVIGYMVNRFQDKPPRFIVVEPNNAACMLASAAAGDGLPHAVEGDLHTIMAGLACGEPSPPAWSILRDFSSCFLSCEDFVAANGIRILANPLGADPVVEAGESGSVAIGLLDLAVNCADFHHFREELGLGPDSSVLLFNTEGATDPENYREILWHGKYPGTF